MGTRLAPSFANIYMNHFEDNFVYPYPHKPTVWYRYIDDIFMIWDHGRDELNKFIPHLNTSSESIKFTSEISGTELNFLNVKVKMENSHLTTNLYVKPTDRNTYLPYNSAHPDIVCAAFRMDNSYGSDAFAVEMKTSNRTQPKRPHNYPNMDTPKISY